MNTFAYSAASLRRFVARAAGALPTLCPPTTMETFDLTSLSGRDFVWFKLHGIEHQPYWYGDHHTTALSARQLAQADLEGAVVFVSNCWLVGNDGTHGPMLQALARANPRAIIGGPGVNYCIPHRLGATDLLALYLRFFLQLGFTAYNALRLAKVRLILKRQDLPTTDTLAFRLWHPSKLVPSLSADDAD
mgnify:CR=1 FL=1